MLLTKDKTFYKSFFSLYWVLVLNNIIVLGVGLADNIMIGAYNEAALSGVASVNQLQFVFQQIIMATGNGLVILASQYWGQSRTKEIKKIGNCALFVGVSVSLILFLLARFVPEKVVGLFTTSEAIIEKGVEYISIIKYTYPIFALTNVLLACLRSVETVRIGFYVSVVTFFVNCGINYLLIGGNLGCPELGVTGAAIGTLSARIMELVIVLTYVFAVDKKLKIKPNEFFSSDRNLMRDFSKTALPIILTGGMFGVSTALQTVILGHMNDSAIAANSVATTLYQTLKVAAIGASSAASVIIGKTIGMGDIKKLKEYTKTLQIMFVAIGTVMSVSLYFLRFPILSLYDDLTMETKLLAESFILVLCVTGFGTAYEMPTLVGIVQGGGDSKFLLKNDFISIWLIVLPLSFLAAFVFDWSPTIVVFCLNLDQLFKCIPAYIKVNSYTWMKKLTRSEDAV